MEQKELSFIVVGMQNDIATLKDNLAFFYTTKHTLTMQSSNHAAWHLPIEVENICLNKNPHTDIYNSFIHYCQNLEATKIPFSR